MRHEQSHPTVLDHRLIFNASGEHSAGQSTAERTRLTQTELEEQYRGLLGTLTLLQRQAEKKDFGVDYSAAARYLEMVGRIEEKVGAKLRQDLTDLHRVGIDWQPIFTLFENLGIDITEAKELYSSSRSSETNISDKHATSLLSIEDDGSDLAEARATLSAITVETSPLTPLD